MIRLIKFAKNIRALFFKFTQFRKALNERIYSNVIDILRIEINYKDDMVKITSKDRIKNKKKLRLLCILIN